IDTMVEHGAAIVGTPDECIESILKLDEISGGFGGLMALAHEWAPREKVLRSFELFARYVMPRFQGSLTGLEGSQRWAAENNETFFGHTVQAIMKATADHYNPES